jgi:hypothetical protein
MEGGKENVENLQGFERQESLVDGDCLESEDSLENAR